MGREPSTLNSERRQPQSIDSALIKRLYEKAQAGRWPLSGESFAAQLELSARRVFGDGTPEPGALERYLRSLHLEDLALACACAEGVERAWEHFIREYRPILYRAADAMDASGGAREIADSLYAELFGLNAQSAFRYFHGRSSLATWLRAVLSQRFVDRIRRERRIVPLPTDEAPNAVAAPASVPDPSAARYLEIMRRVVSAAVGALAPRDRLRLACYYAQHLTLAQIGKAFGEHEATVSRQLARTRSAIRKQVEAMLRDEDHMTEGEIAECFAAVLQDSGTLDLAEMLGAGADSVQQRKKVVHDRSR